MNPHRTYTSPTKGCDVDATIAQSIMGLTVCLFAALLLPIASNGLVRVVQWLHDCCLTMTHLAWLARFKMPPAALLLLLLMMMTNACVQSHKTTWH